MKQLTLMTLVLSTVVLAGCTLPWSPDKNDTMMNNDTMTDQDRDVMEQNDGVAMIDNTMTQDDTAMTVWSYETYSSTAVQSALSADKEVVLFFHAARCPSCKSLDESIKANQLPANTVVFKIDYDNSTDLKKQYGVTTQHTLVRIDADMSMIEKNIGGTFNDLVDLF